MHALISSDLGCGSADRNYILRGDERLRDVFHLTEWNYGVVYVFYKSSSECIHCEIRGGLSSALST